MADMHDELAERVQAVIDWFERVPAKARAHDGTLMGHYVDANDWRAVRSELNQIGNRLRVIHKVQSPGQPPVPTTSQEDV